MAADRTPWLSSLIGQRDLIRLPLVMDALPVPLQVTIHWLKENQTLDGARPLRIEDLVAAHDGSASGPERSGESGIAGRV
jgi:hypothetical protein